MIIWGWRGRETEQATGQFHCPQCRAEQGYQLMRVGTYFTLYFIPLFETTHHGNYVSCRGCGGQFREEVLDYKPPSAAEAALASVQADLLSGTPIEMARTKLVNAGLPAAAASQLVALAAGERRTHCPKCNLLFVSGVSRCSSCGGALG